MNATVAAISARFGPPSMTLRDGRIQDDYGSESCAKLVVNHRTTVDVTDEELEYYQDVYTFLTPDSLLFYLAPVTTWLSRHPNSGRTVFDSFVWSLDRHWKAVQEILSSDETEAVLTLLKSLRDKSDLEYTYGHCTAIFANLPN